MENIFFAAINCSDVKVFTVKIKHNLIKRNLTWHVGNNLWRLPQLPLPKSRHWFIHTMILKQTNYRLSIIIWAVCQKNFKLTLKIKIKLTYKIYIIFIAIYRKLIKIKWDLHIPFCSSVSIGCLNYIIKYFQHFLD